ncbi:MAG: hypothetical protein KGI90_07025 [Burkholderiales bacterium]|nr:hypothetical protein [Burkholderiales bacterium]
MLVDDAVDAHALTLCVDCLPAVATTPAVLERAHLGALAALAVASGGAA